MAVEIGFVREQRSLWKAIGNGVMCRCPNCGKGKLFRSYLKLNDTCSECSEKLSAKSGGTCARVEWAATSSVGSS